MNRFISPNKADNVSILTASAFLSKLVKLGFRISALYLDETEGGASETSYIPLSDLSQESLDEIGDTKINCLVYGGGNFHNVAKLIREWGTGTIQDFTEVFQNFYPGSDASSALLNVPGAAKAIEAILKKA